MLVGGKTDDLHGKPVPIRGKVKSLHDGDFIETEIRHGVGAISAWAEPPLSK